MRRLLPLALAVPLASLACDSSSGDGGSRNDDILALDGDVAAGETVFTSKSCSTSSCHGADGSSGTAPALRDTVPNRSDGALIDSVLDGRGNMPPNDLTDQEMADALAWLRDRFG